MCDRVLRQVNVRLMKLAAARASEKSATAIARAVRVMAEAPTSTKLGENWYLVQRQLADAAESPVLHLLSRCLAGSILKRRVRAADLPMAAARELLDASETIADQVVAHRRSGLRHEHLRCQEVLKPFW
jgi:DNA-binding FadR family transcriptional regulator